MFISFFSFIFISWRLITLQYCSGFCHTLTWISHGFTWNLLFKKKKNIICFFGHTGLGCSIQTPSCDMWDLVPWPGIDPGLIVGAWNVSHWCTKEVLCGTHSCFTLAAFEINSAFLTRANVGFGPWIPHPAPSVFLGRVPPTPKAASFKVQKADTGWSGNF